MPHRRFDGLLSLLEWFDGLLSLLEFVVYVAELPVLIPISAVQFRTSVSLVKKSIDKSGKRRIAT